ncbi:MAG: hypothetical protein H0W88_01885 [Parachlamydiaceae bacterium]|nr:hypothetical protein [Parachlamydiaceae bacterium]
MLISRLSERDSLQQFHGGRPIRNIILVCDVDGVIRNSTEADADSQIIKLIHDLVATQHVDVAFISGTPVSQNPSLETWRRGNHTLDKAVGKYFSKELEDNKVTIYGALGGQRMTKEGFDITVQYPPVIMFELGKLLLHAFLEDVKDIGTSQQIKYTENLKILIDELELQNKHQISTVTANEFSEVVFKIHSQLDSNFRLVSYGAFVESQTSNPPWNAARSLEWIKKQLNCPDLLISKFPEEQKQLAMGLAHRGKDGFNFLMISKTNKSHTIKKHLQEKLLLYPDALIVTIGDTQVDFPMHQHAHLSYHVGQEEVWKNHSLPHCILVQDKIGRDRQHVNGTHYVLNSLKNNIGKPLADWNIPLKDNQSNALLGENNL